MTSLTETPSACERIILQTGFGLYHYFVIGIASACAFAQANTLTSISFAIPLATCDLLLPESTFTSVYLTFTIGTIIGGYLMCTLCDVSGRRHMIPITLIVMFMGVFACGFVHEIVMIITCVLFAASGLAGNIACVKIILGEILPMHTRGFYLILPDVFWTLGYMTTAVIDWLLTPSIINQQSMGLRAITWRIIFGMSGLCCTAVACATALIEQSPRYLMLKKEYLPALMTLKHVFAVNTSRHIESFTVVEDELHTCVKDYGTNEENRSRSCPLYTWMQIKKIKNLTLELFKDKFLKVTLILIAIKLFIPFGLMNVNIWLAKMLEENSCNFSASEVNHIEDVYQSCAMKSKEIYQDYFLIALAIFFGKFIALFTVDRFGRRTSISDSTLKLPNFKQITFLVIGCVITTIASVLFATITKTHQIHLALAIFIMTGCSIIDSILSVILVEVYPTAIRATAAGFIPILANVVGIFVYFYAQFECRISLLVFAAFSPVLSWFLPELARKPMVE